MPVRMARGTLPFTATSAWLRLYSPVAKPFRHASSSVWKGCGGGAEQPVFSVNESRLSTPRMYTSAVVTARSFWG